MLEGGLTDAGFGLAGEDSEVTAPSLWDGTGSTQGTIA
jgi:hypothetical protein